MMNFYHSFNSFSLSFYLYLIVCHGMDGWMMDGSQWMDGSPGDPMDGWINVIWVVNFYLSFNSFSLSFSPSFWDGMPGMGLIV